MLALELTDEKLAVILTICQRQCLLIMYFYLMDQWSTRRSLKLVTSVPQVG